jgi:cholesterol oxidase
VPGGTESEVVVIGSGFGGSSAAVALTEAGLSVTMIERGPWRDTLPVRSMGVQQRVAYPRGWGLYTGFLRTLNAPFLPSGRLTTNRNGLFELFYSRGLEVVCSSSVGGGSHIYSAVHARPPDPNYWDGHVPEISEAVMRPHYEDFLARMGSVVVPPEHRALGHVARRFADSPIVDLVRPPHEIRVGFLLPQDPDNPKRVRTPQGIERDELDPRSGDYGFLGAPSGAKTTLDFAYLAPAMRAGLEIWDRCEVSTIERLRNARARYAVHLTDHRNGARRTLLTDHVVVAAGTMNTLRILLQSRDSVRTLDGMPMLGRRFGGNGDVRGLWVLKDVHADLSIGLPSQGSIRLRDAEEPRQALSNNSLPSVDAYPFPRAVRERLKRCVVIAGMGPDAMDGRVSWWGGNLRIDFDPGNSPVYARILKSFRQLEALHGTRIYAFDRPSTVHPMGGASLGTGPDHAVVDASGEVFGHPGLFVADGTTFPSSIGGPPTASIAAWGRHVGCRLVERLGGRPARPALDPLATTS